MGLQDNLLYNMLTYGAIARLCDLSIMYVLKIYLIASK